MTAEKTEPTSISAQQFAQNVADSGLSNSAELISETASTQSGEEQARQLVTAGKITHYRRTPSSNDLHRLADGQLRDPGPARCRWDGTVFKRDIARMKRIVALKVLSRLACAVEISFNDSSEVETHRD